MCQRLIARPGGQPITGAGLDLLNLGAPGDFYRDLVEAALFFVIGAIAD
jgi:hypothetical protein